MDLRTALLTSGLALPDPPPCEKKKGRKTYHYMPFRLHTLSELRRKQLEHTPEMPTRFAGQLQTMLRSFMIINFHETGKLELKDYHLKIISKLALDSVDSSRRTAIVELSKYDVLHTSGLATKIGMPTNSVRRWLEDLVALEVAEREKGSGSKGDQWKIKKEYRDIIEEFEGIKHEGAELTEATAEPIEPNEQQLLAEAEELKMAEEAQLKSEGLF